MGLFALGKGFSLIGSTIRIRIKAATAANAKITATDKVTDCNENPPEFIAIVYHPLHGRQYAGG